MRYAALWRASDVGPPRTHGDIPVAEDRRFGVRAASDVGRCASRGSTAARVVGGRALLRHPTPRSTTPSMSKAAAKIKAREQAGIDFLFANDSNARKRG